MARRPFQDGRPALSPRARVVAGWLVTIGLLVGVALAFRVFGGDGTSVEPESSASARPGEPLPIAFGTNIDASTGEVAADARTERFTDGDTFAYSVRPAEAPPETVYVEIRRTTNDEVVQAPLPLELRAEATVIAFSLPAGNLLTAFGAGRYVMLILADPAADALARGEFVLVPDP